MTVLLTVLLENSASKTGRFHWKNWFEFGST
jgi:hypothetical protein